MNSTLFPKPDIRLNRQFWRGRRVGIFGGSFNPPHSGHRLIAQEALKRFNLDCVWWMVSPQNPIKTTSGHADFLKRLDITESFVKHPHMLATGIEKDLGTPYSYKTVMALKKLFPKTEFIWIAGMDNAAVFHRWNDWQKLACEIPFVFFNRPPYLYKVQKSCLHICPHIQHHYDRRNVPAKLKAGHMYWVYKGHSKNISSSALRLNNTRI